MREKRLKILDSIISSNKGFETGYRRIDLIELIRERLDAEKCISLRQFAKDLDYLKELAGRDGVNIDIDYVRDTPKSEDFLGGENKRRRFFMYKYSEKGYSVFGLGLNNKEIGLLGLATSIITSISGLEISKGLKEIVENLNEKAGFNSKGDLGTIIKFDDNPDLVGLGHLPSLIHAIQNKQVLDINYIKYDGTEVPNIVHPYFVKIWRSRYYVFGWNEEHEAIHNYPIDRIQSIFENHNVTYNGGKYVKPDDHLKDIIGVSIYQDKPIQEIKFKLRDYRRNDYLKTKPLHSSQHFDEKEDIFSITVRPNKELESEFRYWDAELLTKVDFS